jgi:hypothetical protein
LNVPPLRVGWGGVAAELVDPLPTYYVMLGAAAAVFAGLLWLDRSPLGTVFRGIRDNDERTAYFGYDVAAYKTFGFALSGAVAGLAGALFVTQLGFVSPALIGFPLSTEVLTGSPSAAKAARRSGAIVALGRGILSGPHIGCWRWASCSCCRWCCCRAGCSAGRCACRCRRWRASAVAPSIRRAAAGQIEGEPVVKLQAGETIQAIICAASSSSPQRRIGILSVM